MFSVLRSRKFNLIGLIFLTIFGGGLLPVRGFQIENGEKIDPWEKPIPLCWSYEADALVNIPNVANSKGFLFAAPDDGAVAALDAATGKQAWHAGLGGEIQALQTSDIGRLIVATRQEGEKKDDLSLFVQALSEESGVTIWRKEIDLKAKFFMLVRANAVFLIGEEGSIIALDLRSGEILWQTNTGTKLSGTPLLSEKSIFAGSIDKKVLETGLENGKLVQNYPLSSAISGPIAITNDSIVFSDPVGNIFAIRLSNGTPFWKARAGAEVTDITVMEKGVLVSSNDNFVYMLYPGRGDRKWKRKFSGRLLGKPVLQGNYGVFVTAAGTEAVILNTTNGKFVNNISLLDGAYFTGAATSLLQGFSLSTSRGISFYDPNGCGKR